MNDKWLRLVGVPAVALVALAYYNPEAYTSGPIEFAIGMAIAFFHTIIIWEGNRLIHVKLRNIFPGYYNTKKRITAEIVLALFYTIIITSLLTYFGRPPSDYQPHFFEKGGILMCVYDSIFFSLIMLALFMTIYEAQYFKGEWKKNIQQTESLARSHIESQLDTLKKQIDPHFLFNSLNTLSALIKPDNDQARTYLEQLSDVYRYVLTTRDKTTVSLEEELHFLDAYLYLNKTRFRENLTIEKAISGNLSKYHIPALSLQILVENALKHNIVSQAHPLHINISQQDHFITVSNNKQLRTSLKKSTKIGLQNIIDRYELLSSAPVEIKNEKHIFSVKLPLLLTPGH